MVKVACRQGTHSCRSLFIFRTYLDRTPALCPAFPDPLAESTLQIYKSSLGSIDVAGWSSHSRRSLKTFFSNLTRTGRKFCVSYHRTPKKALARVFITSREVKKGKTTHLFCLQFSRSRQWKGLYSTPFVNYVCACLYIRTFELTIALKIATRETAWRNLTVR